jgi:hypothetical protein
MSAASPAVKEPEAELPEPAPGRVFVTVLLGVLMSLLGHAVLRMQTCGKKLAGVDTGN